MVRLWICGAVLVANVSAGDVSFWRSRPVAVVSSAFLPGTGQLLLGAQKRGEAIIWLEGAAWFAWTGFTWYGNSRQEDAKLMARREAGADISQTARRYYTALERYDNSEQFNEDIRREARSRYPNDPQAQHQYYLQNGYFGEQAWDWSSDSARIGFWRVRRSSRTALQRAGFVAAGMVLNRLVSVLDCTFFVPRPNAQSRLEFGTGRTLASLEFRYRL